MPTELREVWEEEGDGPPFSGDELPRMRDFDVVPDVCELVDEVFAGAEGGSLSLRLLNYRARY